MYKYLLSFLIVLVFKTTYLAQVNLVPNGGFENYTQCPDEINDLDPDALENIGWRTLMPHPDIFNSCSTFSYISTPKNVYGYQIPSSGNGYLGLAAYYNGIPNGRETAQTELLSTLLIGTKYYLRMKISPTLDSVLSYNLFTNRIGINLSTVSSSSVLPNFAHLKTNSVITDTLGWTELFGSIIADSSYKYISLGVFYNDNSVITQTVFTAPYNGFLSYIYIDDVCISTDSAFCKNFTQQSPNAINDVYLKQLRVYPNPIENKIVKLSEVLYNRRIRLIDCKGEVVFGLENYTGKELQLPKELKEGIYNLTIDGFISKRIILLQK